MTSRIWSLCPSLADSIAKTLALLPRGRAWQTNEGGPRPFILAPFERTGFEPTAFETRSDEGTIIYRFFAAIGGVRNYLEQRLCALRWEFWCQTQSETEDLWLKEYGLPDPCDPFPDLCTKVAAQGGARCEFYNAVLARVGWTVECDDGTASCGDRMGGAATMGCAQMGVSHANTLRLLVHVNDSPAYTGGTQTPPLMGLLQMGQPISCAPAIDPLQCLVERIAQAHVTITYVPTTNH